MLHDGMWLAGVREPVNAGRSEATPGPPQAHVRDHSADDDNANGFLAQSHKNRKSWRPSVETS